MSYLYTVWNIKSSSSLDRQLSKYLRILIQEDLDVTHLMVQTVSCLFRLASFHFPGQLSDLQRCNHSFAIFPMH